MNARKSIISTTMVFALCGLLTSCGNKASETTENIETQVQIDSAHNAGREAARKIIIKEWKDSMEFQNAVLEAKSERSRYEMAKQHKCIAAFDSAFVSTIRTTRPDLAKQFE